MSISCEPNNLAALAKCFKCLPGATLQEVQTYLLCQILNNGGTGGGGSGTVTSFSSGNLSPLFTTSVATATTTPALSFAAVAQAANLFYVGPAAGGAVAPTFRAMVNADIPTTLTPQITRLGVGVAVDPAIALNVVAAAGGEVARFNQAGATCFITVGGGAANTGCYMLYNQGANQQEFGIHGSASLVTIDSAGNVSVTAGNLSVSPGIYQCQGSNGFSAPNGIYTTFTFVGGLCTNAA